MEARNNLGEFRMFWSLDGMRLRCGVCESVVWCGRDDISVGVGEVVDQVEDNECWGDDHDDGYNPNE